MLDYEEGICQTLKTFQWRALLKVVRYFEPAITRHSCIWESHIPCQYILKWTVFEYQLSHYHMIKGLILADTTKKKASLAVKKMNENFFMVISRWVRWCYSNLCKWLTDMSVVASPGSFGYNWTPQATLGW